MFFGLKKSDLSYIVKKIREHDEIEKAVIFGSRAKGINKPGSDIDIAIYGEKINVDTVSSLQSALQDEGPLPYFVDVFDYTHSDYEEIKAHIDRVGIVIYSGSKDKISL